MKIAKNYKLKQLIHVVLVIIDPIFNVKKAVYSIPRYFFFIRDLIKYKRLPGVEKLSFLDLQPNLHDKDATAGVGGESFYQNAWAIRCILENKVNEHVDVGSNTLFVGMLSASIKVTAIDIRPFLVNLENLEYKKGDILQLPFDDASINSLSCLHTIEHIGLGRYGDALDPEGSKKAIKELQRVIASEGNLYIAVPVGRQRTKFNKSRVFSPHFIISEFGQCELKELSGLDAEKKFHRNIDINILESLEYGLGLFHFRKRLKSQ
jgi:SAM-dependent methyltransferase